jgi:hypothetical protein
MKFITKILMFIAVICLLSSCGLFQPDDTTTVTTTEIQTTKPLPTYQPGAVKLRDAQWFRSEYDIDYEMKYRKCYYTIGGGIEDDIVYAGVATMDEVNQYIDQKIIWPNNDGFADQMPLKQLVEHFNLPRDAFDRFVEGNLNLQEYLVEEHPNDSDYDMSSEEWEIPNPDIIYTFDDEIINNYYRRE